MRVFYFVLFFLIIFGVFVSGQNVDFDVKRNIYSSHETFQAEVIFNVELSKELKPSDWKLISDSGSSVSLPIGMNKIDKNKYFVYFEVPEISGNYKFGVFNFYYNNNGLQKSNFFTELQIVESSENILNVRPAYVFRSVEGYDEVPYTLFLENLGDNDLDINISIIGDFLFIKKDSFILPKGSSKNVNVLTSLFNKEGDLFEGKIVINYGSLNYDIPYVVKRVVIAEPEIPKEPVIGDVVETPEIPKEPVKTSLIFGDLYGNALIDGKISEAVFQGESKAGDFSIVNSGKESIKDVRLFVKGNILGFVKSEPSFIEEIPGEGVYPVRLIINDNKDLDGDYQGDMVVNYDSEIFSLPIFINLVERKNESIIDEPVIDKPVVEPPKNNKSFIYIIIFFILLIMILLIYFIYKKNKSQEEEFGSFIEKVRKR